MVTGVFTRHSGPPPHRAQRTDFLEPSGRVAQKGRTPARRSQPRRGRNSRRLIRSPHPHAEISASCGKRICLLRAISIRRMNSGLPPVKPFAVRRAHRPPSTAHQRLKSTLTGRSLRLATSGGRIKSRPSGSISPFVRRSALESSRSSRAGRYTAPGRSQACLSIR
jgi:hypothetical protein